MGGLIYWPLNPLIFQGATLILGLADGLAGLLGQKFGRYAYHITGPKTIEGSLTFFGVTVVILLSLLFWQHILFDNPRLLLILGGALLLTLTEALFSRGWDNLPVPLVAGAILYFLL